MAYTHVPAEPSELGVADAQPKGHRSPPCIGAKNQGLIGIIKKAERQIGPKHHPTGVPGTENTQSNTTIRGKAICPDCHHSGGISQIPPRLGLVDSRLPSLLRRVVRRSSDAIAW